MEKDLGSPCPYMQYLDLNWLRAQPDLEHQRTNLSGHINTSANMDVPNDNGTLPASRFSNEQDGGFNGLPQYRQAFTPRLNRSSREKADIGSFGNSNEPAVPDSVYNCAQESFLVLDQTEDQTTFIFSSGIRTHAEFPTSWNPKLLNVDNLIGNQPGHKSEPIFISDQILIDELNEESEMHEDTEDLIALLYSDEDDSDSSDDDEVTSKYPTLCKVKFIDPQELFDGCAEQVASSDEPHSDVPSVMNTTCSGKRKRSAQSDDNIFAWYSKKSKKKRIRDNLNLLQSIIPYGEGKTAIDILDEAITYYVQSLKK